MARKLGGGFIYSLLAILIFTSASRSGENITYNGATPALQAVGSWGDALFPGAASNPGANNNKVTIDYSAGNDPAYVFGGLSASGNVTNNEVFLVNGTITNRIFGGHSTTGDVSHNIVSVLGGTVAYSVIGGQSVDGEVADNHVVMVDGAMEGRIYGGFSTNGAASNNSVSISGGTVKKDTSSTDAFVLGGYSESATAAASGNKVTITGTAVVEGHVYGASSSKADAVGNMVNISGGTVTKEVYGSLAEKGNASNNQIVISGGKIGGRVFGGFSMDNGDANYNSISISGAPDLSTSELVGGVALQTGKVLRGNTLNVKDYSGTAIKKVDNFQNYNFFLPSAQANTTPLISVTNASNISGSTIGVYVPGGAKTLHINDTIALINNTGLTANNITAQSRQGVFLVYDMDLSIDANNLVATVRALRTAPEAKVLPEGRAASLAVLRQGADLVVDSGFNAANNYLGRTGSGWSGPALFGTVGGGHSRIKTGSHVDVDGVSMLAGLAWRNNGPCGALLLGAFFEAGYSDYDTHNAFASGAVRSDGDNRHFGGGLLARYNWQSGFYVEASGRVGGMKNKFHSDLTDAFGHRAKYDITSPYFGAHAGIGYKWQWNEKSTLDLSTKYLWARQNSDTAVVTGDPVRFDADNSHRLRTGARFSYAVDDCISPYAGVAFEYEFDGKSRARAHGFTSGVPSLKGGTGIGEIGLTVQRSSFSADLGVQGHVGRRDGITGSLRVGWKF